MRLILTNGQREFADNFALHIVTTLREGLLEEGIISDHSGVRRGHDIDRAIWGPTVHNEVDGAERRLYALNVHPDCALRAIHTQEAGRVVDILDDLLIGRGDKGLEGPEAAVCIS